MTIGQRPRARGCTTPCPRCSAVRSGGGAQRVRLEAHHAVRSPAQQGPAWRLAGPSGVDVRHRRQYLPVDTRREPVPRPRWCSGACSAASVSALARNDHPRRPAGGPAREPHRSPRLAGVHAAVLGPACDQCAVRRPVLAMLATKPADDLPVFGSLLYAARRLSGTLLRPFLHGFWDRSSLPAAATGSDPNLVAIAISRWPSPARWQQWRRQRGLRLGTASPARPSAPARRSPG